MKKAVNFAHKTRQAGQTEVLGKSEIRLHRGKSQSSNGSSERSERTSDLRCRATKGLDRNDLNIQQVLHCDYRTEQEALFLYQHVKDMEFFAQFKRDHSFGQGNKAAFVKLCQEAQYKQYKPSDVIFEEGECSEGQFYIILSGKVYVVQKADRAQNCFEEQNRKSLADMHHQQEHSSATSSSSVESNQSSHVHSRHDSVRSKCDSIVEHQVTHHSPHDALHSGWEEKRGRGSLLAPRQLRGLLASNLQSRKVSIELAGSQSFRSLEPRDTTISKCIQPQSTSEINESMSQQSLKLKVSKRQKEAISSSIIRSFDELKLDNEEEQSVKLQNQLIIGVPTPTDVSGEVDVNNLDLNQSPPFRKIVKKVENVLKVRDPQTFEIYRQQEQLKQVVNKYGMLRNSLGLGNAFGHAALNARDSKRSATVVAAADTEVLIINSDNLEFVHQHYKQARERKKDFLLKYFPYIDEVNAVKTVESYLYLMKERLLTRGTVLCKEGEVADKIYVLYEGECRILKSFTVDEASSNRLDQSINPYKRSRKSNQRVLPISTLTKGGFVGVEVLFGDNERYEYTVQVGSTEVKVFAIDKSAFWMRFPKVTRDELGKLYQKRLSTHIAVANRILEARYRNTNVIQRNDDRDISPYRHIAGERKNAPVCHSKNNKIASLSAGISPTNYTSARGRLNEDDYSFASNTDKACSLESPAIGAKLKSQIAEYSRILLPKAPRNENGKSSISPHMQNLKLIQELQNTRLKPTLDEDRTVARQQLSILLSKSVKPTSSKKVQNAHFPGSTEISRVIKPPSKSPSSHRHIVLRRSQAPKLPYSNHLDKSLECFSQHKNLDLSPKHLSNVDDFKFNFGHDCDGIFKRREPNLTSISLKKITAAASADSKLNISTKKSLQSLYKKMKRDKDLSPLTSEVVNYSSSSMQISMLSPKRNAHNKHVEQIKESEHTATLLMPKPSTSSIRVTENTHIQDQERENLYYFGADISSSSRMLVPSQSDRFSSHILKKKPRLRPTFLGSKSSSLCEGKRFEHRRSPINEHLTRNNRSQKLFLRNGRESLLKDSNYSPNFQWSQRSIEGIDLTQSFSSRKLSTERTLKENNREP